MPWLYGPRNGWYAFRALNDDPVKWEAVEEAIELLMEGDHIAALAILRKVMTDDPDNTYAFRYAGAALFELEQYDTAADAYRAAVRLAPDYLGARIGLIHSLRLCNDGDAATAEARETLLRFPEDADAMFALGLALAARGERREAAKALQRFLATTPEVEVQLETQGIIDMLHQEPDGVPLIWK